MKNIPGWIEVVEGWVFVNQVIGIQPSGVLKTRVITAAKDFEYLGTCKDFANKMTEEYKKLYNINK